MQTNIFQRNTEPFWDRIAPKYARKPISDPGAYEEKLRQVLTMLHPRDHILEVGCGTGSTALRIAPYVSSITATDISRRMIEIAQSKLAKETLSNVNFYQAEAVDILDGQPFDAICAFSFLHLVSNLHEVLTSIHIQLKPGGLFISKTVCLKERPLPVQLCVRALTATGVAPYVALLSKAELIRHLKDAGFEIESASHFAQQHSNPFIVARRPAK